MSREPLWTDLSGKKECGRLNGRRTDVQPLSRNIENRQARERIPPINSREVRALKGRAEKVAGELANGRVMPDDQKRSYRFGCGMYEAVKRVRGCRIETVFDRECRHLIQCIQHTLSRLSGAGGGAAKDLYRIGQIARRKLSADACGLFASSGRQGAATVATFRQDMRDGFRMAQKQKAAQGHQFRITRFGPSAFRSPARAGGDGFVMADDFVNDEGQKFFGKVRIEMSIASKLAQAFDLPCFAGRVCRRKMGTGLELSDFLRAAEAFRKHVDQGSVDIVDAAAQAFEFSQSGIGSAGCGRHRLRAHSDQSMQDGRLFRHQDR